jgi:membrane protease YdiL (CAAX protease family)
VGFALLWLLLFVIVSQGAAIVVALAAFAVRAMASGNPKAYLDQAGKPDFPETPEFAAILGPGMLVGEVVSILLGWLVLRLVAGRDWPRKVALRRPGAAHLLFAILLFPAVVIVGAGMAELARLLHIPHLIDIGKALDSTKYWPWWLGVLIIGLGPGIGEELWCRAFLGRGLIGHYGVVVGIILTSVLFGIMHVEPVQVFYAPWIGAILHYVYWTTRSLWLPMLLHTLNNSLAILAIQWGDALPESAQDALTRDHFPPWLYVGAVVLLAAVGFALYQCRSRLAAAAGDGPPPWHPPHPGVEYPPPGSGTKVVHPRPSPLALAVSAGGILVFVCTCYLAFR